MQLAVPALSEWHTRTGPTPAASLLLPSPWPWRPWRTASETLLQSDHRDQTILTQVGHLAPPEMQRRPHSATTKIWEGIPALAVLAALAARGVGHCTRDSIDSVAAGTARMAGWLSGPSEADNFRHLLSKGTEEQARQGQGSQTRLQLRRRNTLSPSVSSPNSDTARISGCETKEYEVRVPGRPPCSRQLQHGSDSLHVLSQRRISPEQVGGTA
ncbi:unnamed protein product [Symbiodinium natans]|uniref:Uncharacterized protein n=1 Tax=Symbiodinium natans TaxID=878477 RepID=A0A812QA03_9DINO|nr:unnamed protein product [Symbiodinium natans]